MSVFTEKYSRRVSLACGQRGKQKKNALFFCLSLLVAMPLLCLGDAGETSSTTPSTPSGIVTTPSINIKSSKDTIAPSPTTSVPGTASIALGEVWHDGETICNKLQNAGSKKDCLEFVKLYPGESGKFKVRSLSKNETFTATKSDNRTIFIFPPGDTNLSQKITITDARHIAIFGDSNKSNGLSYLRKAHTMDEMIHVENCDGCMISNVKANPVFTSAIGEAHGYFGVIEGEKSVVSIRGISINHFSRYGYISAKNAGSVELLDLHFKHEPSGKDEVIPIMAVSAISLENCTIIKGRNIKLENFNPPLRLGKGRGRVEALLHIINPTQFNIKDITLLVHPDSHNDDETNFIGIDLTDPDTIDGTIDNLQVGIYGKAIAPSPTTIAPTSGTASVSPSPTPTPIWSNRWHSLRLSKGKGFKEDDKIKGTININNSHISDKQIVGAELFLDLNINIDGKRVDVWYDGETICNALNNKSSKSNCLEFVRKYPGNPKESKTYKKFKIHNFIEVTDKAEGEDHKDKAFTITAANSRTIYILPGGRFELTKEITMTGASHVAIFGDTDKAGKLTFLHKMFHMDNMVKFDNCEGCMIANVNADPAFTGLDHPKYHGSFGDIEGEKSVVSIRDIFVNTFSSYGYIYADGAKSVELINIDFKREPQHPWHGDKRVPKLRYSAIELNNCANISGNNIKIRNFNPSKGTNLLQIDNPVSFNLQNITLLLNENSDKKEHVDFIGVHITESDKYLEKNSDGKINYLKNVNGTINNLTVGVYGKPYNGKAITPSPTAPTATTSVTPSSESTWSETWHSLKLFKNDDVDLNELIRGKINIDNSHIPDKTILGTRLFPQLQVKVNGVLMLEPLVSTTSKAFTATPVTSDTMTTAAPRATTVVPVVNTSAPVAGTSVPVTTTTAPGGGWQDGETICNTMLNNQLSKDNCLEFVRKYSGETKKSKEFKVRLLKTNETFTAEDGHRTIYILPPGDTVLEQQIQIKHSGIMAIIGDTDKNGSSPSYLRKAHDDTSIIYMKHCHKCMVSNINANPVSNTINNNHHGTFVEITGKGSDVLIRDISINHFSTQGYIYAYDLDSIDLFNIDLKHEPGTSTSSISSSTNIPVMQWSAISIKNCTNITGKNIKIQNFKPTQYGRGSLQIQNPFKFDIQDLTILLHPDSSKVTYTRFIGIDFTGGNNQYIDTNVNGTIENLQVGTYDQATQGKSSTSVWPKGRWFSLWFWKGDDVYYNHAIAGTINIKNSLIPDESIAGTEAFPKLNVNVRSQVSTTSKVLPTPVITSATSGGIITDPILETGAPGATAIVPSATAITPSATTATSDKIWQDGEAICNVLNNKSSKDNCLEFVRKYPGNPEESEKYKKFKVRRLTKNETFTATASNNRTIYILPPGDSSLYEQIDIRNASHIAIFGDTDKSGGAPSYLNKAHQENHMIYMNHCKGCMIANVHANPAFETLITQHYGSFVDITGNTSTVSIRDISINHFSDFGYIFALNADSVELLNIDFKFGSDSNDKDIPVMMWGAIHLDNCTHITGKNIKIQNFKPVSTGDGLLQIKNPIHIDIDDITLLLHPESSKNTDTNFIGIDFKGPNKYSGATRVDGIIKKLKVGTYDPVTKGKSSTLVWPKKTWHSLRLLKNADVNFNELIPGSININESDIPDKSIAGTRLFPKLHVNIDGVRAMEPPVSTASEVLPTQVITPSPSGTILTATPIKKTVGPSVTGIAPSTTTAVLSTTSITPDVIWHDGETICNNMLNNQASKDNCLDFVRKYPGNPEEFEKFKKFRVRHLANHETFTALESDSRTIYILPSGVSFLFGQIKIYDASHIAILGDTDKSGSAPSYLNKAHEESRLIHIHNCKGCMISNVHANPAVDSIFTKHHGSFVGITGGTSAVSIRDISINEFSDYGYIYANNADSVELLNIDFKFGSDSDDKKIPVMTWSAILLDNCTHITGKNIKIQNFKPVSTGAGLLEIKNPIHLDIDDITLLLHPESSEIIGTRFIGIGFKGPNKYLGATKVDGAIKKLKVGTYDPITKGKSSTLIWPKKTWHSLRLLKDADVDFNELIPGTININESDIPDKSIAGTRLFPKLHINIDGVRAMEPLVSTASEVLPTQVITPSPSGTIPTATGITPSTTTAAPSTTSITPVKIWHDGKTICRKLKNESSQKNCYDFVNKYPKEKFRVRHLTRNEAFTATASDHRTIYILPPGDTFLNKDITITNTSHIAVIGDIDEAGVLSYLRKAHRLSNIFYINNCQGCMISNVKADPVFDYSTNTDDHGHFIIALGKKSDVFIRDISINHFSYQGYIYAQNLNSVELINIDFKHKPDVSDTKIPMMNNGAIVLRNCSDITAENINIRNFNPSPTSLGLIQIINPIRLDLKDITLLLHSQSSKTSDANFIGVQFIGRNKYSDGAEVNGTIKNLIVGEYGKPYDGSSSKSDWSQRWHSLRLFKDPDADNSEIIKGKINIKGSRIPDKTIAGTRLYPNLNVNIDGVRTMEPLVSTASVVLPTQVITPSPSGTIPTATGIIPSATTAVPSTTSITPVKIWYDGKTICNMLNSQESKNNCLEFVGKYPADQFKLHRLAPGEELTVTESDSYTIYILPLKNMYLTKKITVTDARRIALFGDVGTLGYRTSLFKTREMESMIHFDNCQDCLVSNLKVHPVFNNSDHSSAHSRVITIDGESSEVSIKNIDIPYFSYYGYIDVRSAYSVELSDIDFEYIPDISVTEVPALVFSAINIKNCIHIRGSNIKIQNFNPSYVSKDLLNITNPIYFTLENITLLLHKDSPKNSESNFIGINFTNQNKYSGSTRVYGTINNLQVGEYGKPYDGKTPLVWSKKWHSLRLFKNEGVNYHKEIFGKIDIKNSKIPANSIAGTRLFPKLNVNIDGVRTMEPLVSTTSETFTTQVMTPIIPGTHPTPPTIPGTHPTPSTIPSTHPTISGGVFSGEGIDMCKKVSNETSKNNCLKFVKAYPGTYTLHYLNHEDILTVTRENSRTIYVLPAGSYDIPAAVTVTDAEHIAILGDGSYTYLKNSHNIATMITVENCKHCLISNFNVNPHGSEDATEHLVFLSVNGEQSDVDINHIDIVHLHFSEYISAKNAAKLRLSNITIYPGLKTDKTIPPFFVKSVIELNNCKDIYTDYIVIEDINPDATIKASLLKIINPIVFRIHNTTMLLHPDSDRNKDINFIGIDLTDTDKYLEAKIDGLITNLQVGEFDRSTGKKTDKLTPKPWHSLRLFNNEEPDHDTDDDLKIQGTIVIQNSDITKEEIFGRELFHNLNMVVKQTTVPTFASLFSTEGTIPAGNATLSPEPQKGAVESSWSNTKTAILTTVLAGVAVTCLVVTFVARSKGWGPFKRGYSKPGDADIELDNKENPSYNPFTGSKEALSGSKEALSGSQEALMKETPADESE